MHIMILTGHVVCRQDYTFPKTLALAENTRMEYIEPWKPFKPCHVAINVIAFAVYSQTSTNMPGLQSRLKLFA